MQRELHHPGQNRRARPCCVSPPTRLAVSSFGPAMPLAGVTLTLASVALSAGPPPRTRASGSRHPSTKWVIERSLAVVLAYLIRGRLPATRFVVGDASCPKGVALGHREGTAAFRGLSGRRRVRACLLRLSLRAVSSGCWRAMTVTDGLCNSVLGFSSSSTGAEAVGFRSPRPKCAMLLSVSSRRGGLGEIGGTKKQQIG